MASIIRKLTINRGFEDSIPMESHQMLWLPVLKNWIGTEKLDLERLQLFMVKLGMDHD